MNTFTSAPHKRTPGGSQKPPPNTLQDAALSLRYPYLGDAPAQPPQPFWRMAHKLENMSEAERIQSIKQGFAIDWADAARQAFGLPTQNMVELLDLSSATYERRRKDTKPLNAAASERLERIASVALLAAKVFEDETAASDWMARPNPALYGAAPVMHCETEIGARQVRRILNALEWGGAA